MPHMVIFRSAEGKPGYHQAESLDEAVRFVEHLRNTEGVSETRIFRMQEVPIEFKTYYRVEVAASDDAAPVAPVAPAPVEEKAPVVEEPVVVEPMPVGSNGGAGAPNRFGRFNRG